MKARISLKMADKTDIEAILKTLTLEEKVRFLVTSVPSYHRPLTLRSGFSQAATLSKLAMSPIKGCLQSRYSIPQQPHIPKAQN